jgi:hypothetical protein
VLIRELTPSTRFDKSSLFTHIKGARTEHIISLRAHHGRTRGSRAVALTPEQLKPLSAAHTLKFLEDTYVEIDDDATHYTWSDILTATRTPSMTVFDWVDSFTLLTLRYGDTVKRIHPIRSTKINKVVSKQITDDEKAIIATLNTSYSSILQNSGQYSITSLVKLLAQNVTSFTKKYSPSEHMRIAKYLRTRAIKYKNIFELATQGAKGKGSAIKRQKVIGKGQRGWVYLGKTSTTGLTPPAPHSKGKGKGKGKGKSSGKGKSHLSSIYSKGKEKGKGKGKGKTKGKRSVKGKPSLRGPAPGSAPVHIGSNVPASESLKNVTFVTSWDILNQTVANG